MQDLDTCDILLFRGNGIFGRILEFFGKSKYSHVGLVLKNPSFLNKTLEDGLYILESSYNNTPDSEDGKYKVGVQIHKLEDVLNEYGKGAVYVRKVVCNRDESFYKKLEEIHTEVHNKPYDMDIGDWVMAKYDVDKQSVPKGLGRTNEFWCSALASYVFRELGLIEDVNWTYISPREFSAEEGTFLKFLCEVKGEECLK
jgi:cell wall-associated NlpC family hydrolase